MLYSVENQLLLRDNALHNDDFGDNAQRGIPYQKLMDNAEMQTKKKMYFY